jgi:hypothetical protein
MRNGGVGVDSRIGRVSGRLIEVEWGMVETGSDGGRGGREAEEESDKSLERQTKANTECETVREKR